jgi:hypothetical protein
MPTGLTTHTTTATGTPAGGDAVQELNALSGSLEGQLVTGTNVLCAEVHQNSTFGDDIYFGARLRLTAPAVGGVMINEVKPAVGAGSGFVEFYNPTGAAVNLQGYYLSDTEANLTKFQISQPTVVPAGGLAVVGFAESMLGAASPVTVLLTQPDGYTRQSGFLSGMVADGRSAGRKPTGGSTWVLFTQPTPGLPNASDPAPVVALSEVHFGALNRVDWVEFHNPGPGTQALDGLFVAADPDLVTKVPLTGSLAAGEYASVAVDFAPDADGGIRLFLADRWNNIISAAEVELRPGLPSVQAWPAGSLEWYATPMATRDAPNDPERQTAIVINEIMARPPSSHEEGEYLEFYNQGATTVDMAGWTMDDGISYTFPPGTTLAAGQYLVLAKDPGWMAVNYPALTSVQGPFGGNLRNRGEQLRLLDARGNLADVVDYNQGGQWPVGAGGEGSSLELIHPAMDNSKPSAWRASDETTKSSFQTFSHTGLYRELRGIGPGASTSRELQLYMPGEGYVILRNIRLSKATAPATNLIPNGDATSHNGNGSSGFLCTGTHCDSDSQPRTASPPRYNAMRTTDQGFHLISQGGGDTKANKAEVDVTGIAPNDTLTLSFEGRWVYGQPLMIAQTWDRSFGKVFRFPIPNNLGTPGAVNSRSTAAPAPTVDAMAHFPVVPTSSQPVVVTARVTSAGPLTAVTLMQRQDTVAGTATWNTIAMNDNGTAGDAVAGDGLWSGTVPARANGAITQFYVTATAANGQANECPRQGVRLPGMWIVANTPPSTAPGLLIQRNIISLYHRNALNASTGYSSAYDWDHPRMSNYGFNATMIYNETEVYYNSELRRGGSPWTRTSANTLDRTRWKPPGDQLFRERSKAGVDNDSAGASRFHNRIIRYMMHLFGYPVPHAEFIVQIVNADGPRLGDEMEQTDSDFFDRAYPDGSNGELYEIDDAWYMYDSNNMDDRIDAGSVTGRWELRDWNGTAALPSDESPIFFHGNWPLRFPEDKYDYSALSSMIKTAVNNNTGVTSAQEAGYRERMERVIDPGRAAVYAAVRGYAADWDNFTMSRGKNGYFYKRPGDGRFEFHHWDSDLAFQSGRMGDAIIGSTAGIGWTNFSNRPWFRQKLNYYLTELIDRYTSTSSPRMNAWLAAMNYQAANTNALAPFKTSLFNYPAAWFASRNPQMQTFLGTNYTRAFTFSTATGQTVNTPVFSISGSASSKIAVVDIPGHPEAVFSWVPTIANNGLWTLSNIRLAAGLNSFSLRALRSDGTVSASLPFTVTLSVNAPPVVVLVTDPASGNVTAGETLLLDATASFDPEGLGLTYAWTVSPTAGSQLTQPEFGRATARFNVPGNYTLTLQVTDAASQSVSVVREFSVYNAAGFDSFGSAQPLGPDYMISNLEYRDNFSPSAWYSLEDLTGRILIQVLDDAARPMASPTFTHPLITRDLPDSGDFILQTRLLPDSREFGNWRAGLMLEVNEAGTTVRYAFALDGGLNLIVQRAALPGAWTPLTTVPSPVPVTGSGAVIRIVRNGSSLLFQQQTSDVWTTLLTQPVAAGTVAGNGGIFVATSTPTSVRIGFDYLLIADPSATNSVLNNLRITELHYRPASGGVEFIELRNTGSQAISLAGVNFDLGAPFSMNSVPVTPYVFGNETLNPGEFITLTHDVPLFRSLYGQGPRLAPAWTSGNLSNNGERILLLDAAGNAVHDFTYSPSSPWPAAANGNGPSLEVVSINGDYNDGTNWRASSVAGGNPGSGPDRDGDGVSDEAEALFGTNPDSPGSAPAVTITANPGGGLTLTWPSVPGVVYRVESSTPLSGWTTIQTLTGTGTWTFTPTPGVLRNFYRIVASNS